MANVFSKFKMLIGVEDVEEEVVVETPAPAPQPATSLSEPRKSTVDRASSYDRNNTFVQPRMEPREHKVVSMQSSGKKPFKLIVTEPKSFDECPRLVDNLKSKKPVIINLEKLENEKARKIFDFLSGATYALDGNVQKVANNIFVFAPESVDVLANFETPGKNNSSEDSNGPWRK